MFQRQLKAAVGVMVLLGTGWFFGIFMSLPAPQFQVGMQYLFILLNSSQVRGFYSFYSFLCIYQVYQPYENQASLPSGKNCFTY